MKGYRKLDGVVWSEHRNNDGDSFFVSFEGEEFELRPDLHGGEDTPDGRYWRDYKDHVIRLERLAQQKRIGA